EAFTNDIRKVWATFSWLPSPHRGFWPNLVHSLAYGLVMTFGLWGMWAYRRAWREHLIIYALFFSFCGVVAVFFGHTRHRAFLDLYWIVFAAGLLDSWRATLFQRYRPEFMKLALGGNISDASVMSDRDSIRSYRS